jgi:hypothetical protein
MVEFLFYSIGLHVDTYYIFKLSHKLKVNKFKLTNNKALYGIKDRRHHLLQGIGNLLPMVVTIVGLILLKLLVNGKSPAMVFLNAATIKGFGRAFGLWIIVWDSLAYLGVYRPPCALMIATLKQIQLLLEANQLVLGSILRGAIMSLL